MLPEAEFAFLDELFNANSAILNNLITVLNERVYRRGAETHRLPLVSAFAASNHLPEDEALQALFDRFLLRCRVESLPPPRLPALLAAGWAIERDGTAEAVPADAPTAEDLRAMGEAVVEYLVDFLGGLDDAPASNTEGALELARSLRGSPPEVGGDFEETFARMLEAIEHTYEFAGPGYLAYIPGGGLHTAALGEFLAQGVNRYANLWAPSPAVVQLEQNCVRWICDLFDYPGTARGLLTSGGVTWKNASTIYTFSHAKYLLIDHTTAVIMSMNFNIDAMNNERNYGMVDKDPEDVADLQ